MKKNIAIINPEDFGYDLAVLARKMGYAVTGVMIETPDRYKVLKGIYCFDTAGSSNAYDEMITSENWEDAAWQLRRLSPCAVISGSEIAVDYSDRIAAVLGLPCNDPDTIPLRRSKIEMKNAVKNAGLCYAEGDTFSDFTCAAAFVRSHTGYPVVVKPVCGAGSKNVAFCKNELEFARAFKKVQDTPDAYLRNSSSVLVEKYIPGNEYVVNMFGTPEGICVTDIWKYEKIGNRYSDCVYYNDIMQDVNAPEFTELKKYACKVYTAVGIRIGPAHAEIKLSAGRPVLIEIGSRLAGGEMPKYAALTTSFNSLENTIRVFIDGTVPLPEEIQIHSYAASSDISHEKFGRLSGFNGLAQIRKLPTYKAEVLYAGKGDYIEPTKDVDHLAALFWFTGTDRKQITQDLEQSHKLCSVNVENSRILVVGTTSDYVDLLRRQYPNRLLFITDKTIRETAKEKPPLRSEEILCSLMNFSEIYRLLTSHLKKYEQTITGITCYDCESLLLTSYIAEKMHLRFPSADAVKNCRSKSRSIALWQEAGIKCPATAAIGSYEEAESFFSSHQPCVVKPVSGSGAELTFLCRSKEQLAAAWDTIMIKIEAKAGEPMYHESCGGSRDILIQEYVQGTEYSCDFIFTQGCAVILRMNRKRFRDTLFGVTAAYELLPVSQWPEPPEKTAALLYKAAAAAGNLEGAIIMVDMIQTPQGFTLLEMSPRAGGDCLPFLIQAAAGVSTVNLAVELAAGKLENPKPLQITEPLTALRLFADKEGCLVSQDTAALSSKACVKQIVLYQENGSRIQFSETSYSGSLLGYIIYTSDGRPGAVQDKELIDCFKPKIICSTDFITALVNRHIEKKDVYLNTWKENGNVPVWLFDTKQLAYRARTFRSVFKKRLPDCAFYYAVKSDNYPEIAETLLGSGFGLDISSGIELQTALKLGASNMLFSGPGKTDAELESALDYSDRIIILADSFSELARLKKAAERKHVTAHIGVRILPPGGWEKFGIELSSLKKFYEEASESSFIRFEGIQFHTSWNMNSSAQIQAIHAVSLQLKTWTQKELQNIKFLDIGGGYWPEEGEWLNGPDAKDGILAGRIWNPAIPIDQFASELAEAIKREIFPLVHCRIQFEPGRWLVNDALHCMVSVIDKKKTDSVITDGATNSIGWDRFNTDYFPIINLSRPATSEKPCRIYGSLCDPHDVWGFAYYGTDIREGDVLLIPNQGAYTYSLRQNFIKPLPPVVELHE